MKTPLNISDYFKQTRLDGAKFAKASSIKQGKARKTEFESILNALKTTQKQEETPAQTVEKQKLTLGDYRANTVRNQSLSALNRIRFGESAGQDSTPAPSASGEARDESLNIDNAKDLNQTDFSKAMKRINGLRNQTKGHVRQRIDSCIELASRKYDVPPELIRGIIKAESGFKPNAVSSAGAQGLMQLMPGTAEDLGVKNPFDIYENIDGGVRYFKQMMNEFDGDVKRSLAAYNAGPGAVKRYDGVPPYRETLHYIRKVMKYSNGMV